MEASMAETHRDIPLDPPSQAKGEENIEIDLHRLPPNLRRLIDALGLDDTEALLERRGGTRLKLYRSQLDREFGHARAQALRQAFLPAAYVDLPTIKKLSAQRRNACIRAARAAGVSTEALARQYRITAAYVRMICAEVV
jgi:hypothetical protein